MAITLQLEGAPDLVIGEITPTGVSALGGSSLNVLDHPEYYVTGTEMREYCQANGVGDPTYNCGSSKVQVHWESYLPYIKLIQPNGQDAFIFRGSVQRTREYPLIGGDVDNPTAVALNQQSGTPTNFSWFVNSDTGTATMNKLKAFFAGAKIEPSTKPYQVSYGNQTLLTGETEDSISITYRGQSLATVSEGTKTLKTNNKVTTDDITVNDGTNTKKLKCRGKKLTNDIVITIQ